jgi:hypothetical protein
MAQTMPIAIPLGLLGVAVALMASIKSREEEPLKAGGCGALGPGYEGYVYDPAKETCVPPPGVQGEPAQRLLPAPKSAGPTRGDWPFDGLPFRVTHDGRLYQRSARVPRGVSGYYREVRGPGELAITARGKFVAT